jgi:phospholipid transport system substrate-binding protein
MAFFSLMATNTTALEIGDDGLHKTKWMQDTFKDLREDLEEANTEGKRLVLFFEQIGCIIEQELMPIIDYKYASYKILGKHLKKTSKAQREKFVFAMRHYLVRTYASALTQYKGQQVIFEQGKVAEQAKSASISASILEDKKSPVDLTFQMRKNSKTQQWKAYDLVVEGISLLTSKNAEFNSLINQFGIDQVTEELVELNR